MAASLSIAGRRASRRGCAGICVLAGLLLVGCQGGTPGKLPSLLPAASAIDAPAPPPRDPLAALRPAGFLPDEGGPRPKAAPASDAAITTASVAADDDSVDDEDAAGWLSTRR